MHALKIIDTTGAERAIACTPNRFAGGEVNPRLGAFAIARGEEVHIRSDLRSASDILELLLIVNALRTSAPAVPIHLQLPYVPYARQDRVCAPGEALSIRVMADLINAQRFASVEIWDPHSDVTPALIDRVVVRGALEFVQRTGLFTDPDRAPILVAPDAGALKKTLGLAKALGARWIRADKARDPLTGAVVDTIVYAEHLGDRDVLICDDICDGGRTFIQLAKALQTLTRARIYLYITHGIFSYGYQPILDVIDAVFVANRWDGLPDHPQIKLV